MQAISQKELFSEFLVKVVDIGSNGLSIKEELPCEWISELLKEPESEFAWRAIKPSSIEFQLRPEGEMIHLMGTGVFWLNSSCVRCLKDVPFSLTLHLNLRLFAREKEIADAVAADIELFDTGNYSSLSIEDDVDLSTAYYENGIIDIAALLREQLFLDLPSYPVCNHALALFKSSSCNLMATEAVSTTAPFKENPFAKLAGWAPRTPENEKM